jgi:hypothetical protein
MRTPILERLAALDLTALRKGAHGTHGAHDGPAGPGDEPPQMCLLEAAAWVAGEPWSDHPKCVSPVLGVLGRRLNDVLPDDRRQELKPLVPLLLGTAGDGLDEARSYLALDWLIRTYTPAWLDLAGLTGEATALRDLRRIVDLDSAAAAGPVVRAAWAVARADAGADAGELRDAAWAAAGDATWDSGDVARDAALAAAEAAAEAADWGAAGAAAESAARAAAGDATRAAGRAVLQPTVTVLQTSVIGLFTAMIRPELA